MRTTAAYGLFVDITCGVLLFTFLYTALSKLNNHSLFIFTLSKSPLIGGFAKSLAWAIPAIEIILSVLLIFPQSKSLALWLSFFLVSVFTAYIIYMLLFSSSLPCSCGGVLQEMSWLQHLLFNISLIVLTLLSILFINKKMDPVMKLQAKPKT